MSRVNAKDVLSEGNKGKMNQQQSHILKHNGQKGAAGMTKVQNLDKWTGLFIPLDYHKGFGRAKFKLPRIAQSIGIQAHQRNTGFPKIANMNGTPHDFFR